MSRSQSHKPFLFNNLQEFQVAKWRTWVKEIFRLLPKPYIEGASPVALTARGERAAKRIKAHEWAAGIAPILALRVEGKREFEVYNTCQDYVDKMLRHGNDLEMLDKVRECACEHGVNVSDILPVLAVVLRDEILKLTP